jgi:hypothetical protein
MKEQHFKKHSQYVPGFHFVTLAIILAALVIAIVLMVSLGVSSITIFGLLVAVSLSLLFFYTRQFATGNQDRVIRAEENFRSYRLTGKTVDSRLTRNQLIALRFADDSEYALLLEKAISQNLSPKDIKQAIQQWRADHHRV